MAKTTTTTSAYHGEGMVKLGNNSFYYIDEDLAQGTGVSFKISVNCYTDNDSSISGEMYFSIPASTVYVKHFISTTQRMDYSSVAYTNQ